MECKSEKLNIMKEKKEQETLIACGKDVLPRLAQTYQQLYLIPGTEGAVLYPKIVRNGKDAPLKDLSHFRMNDQDRLEMVMTPAGNVMAVTLHERADFELFLQIMTNKCVPYEVPASQGASTLDGLINWQKIRQHEHQWRKERVAAGEILPDWSSEFQRFTSVKGNYTDVLILLSTGPYSNISASRLGMEEEKWLECSYIIRKYHECTHFVCRRKFPQQINTVWDEIVADAIGIIAAFGRFDPALEETFLGINAKGYTGGRLENYVVDKETLDDLAVKIHTLIMDIAGLFETVRESGEQTGPFDFAVMLEERQEQWWGLS